MRKKGNLRKERDERERESERERERLGERERDIYIHTYIFIYLFRDVCVTWPGDTWNHVDKSEKARGVKKRGEREREEKREIKRDGEGSTRK